MRCLSTLGTLFIGTVGVMESLFLANGGDGRVYKTLYVTVLGVLEKGAISVGYVISFVTITIWASVSHLRERQGEAVLALFQHEAAGVAPHESGADFLRGTPELCGESAMVSP